MDEVLKSELIWKQMRGIFRHFALAKALQKTAALSVLPSNGAWNGYNLTSVSIPEQYPPISVHQHYVWKSNGRTWNYNTDECGGVSLRGLLTVSPSLGSRTELNLIREKVLAAARSCSTSCWDVV